MENHKYVLSTEIPVMSTLIAPCLLCIPK